MPAEPGVGDEGNVALLPAEPGVGDEGNVALLPARKRRFNVHVPAICRFVAAVAAAEDAAAADIGQGARRRHGQHVLVRVPRSRPQQTGRLAAAAPTVEPRTAGHADGDRGAAACRRWPGDGNVGTPRVFICPLRVVHRVADVHGHRRIAAAAGGGGGGGGGSDGAGTGSGSAGLGATAAAAASRRRARAGGKSGHGHPLDTAGGWQGGIGPTNRQRRSPVPPRRDLHSAVRFEPPTQEQLDRVVERAEPARMLADQRPDHVEVGRHRGRGLFGLDPAQRAVDGAGVGAVGVDPVPEGLRLRRAQYDVDLDLVGTLDGSVELEQAPGPLDVPRVVPRLQHGQNPADCNDAVAKLLLEVLDDAVVAHPELIEAERADPDAGSLRVALGPCGPGRERRRDLGDQVAPAVGEQGVGWADVVVRGQGVDVGAAHSAVPGADGVP